MAKTGLSRPYYAVYNDNGDGTVTYSDGARLAKAVETHVSLNDSGDNILYGDNGPAESDRQFSGGTINIITTDLPLDDAAVMYGLEVEEVTLSGTPTATGRRIRFKGDQAIPYLGYGVVVMGQINNVPYYMALVLHKIQMSNPGDDYVTKGDSISWQTPSLNGTVLRDDTDEHNWRDWVQFTTEAQADQYIKETLNITDIAEG